MSGPLGMPGFPHIAVVDDEKAVVDILGYSLKKKLPQSHVSTFSNGQEALEWLESNRVDLLLTDLNMPGIGGRELVTMMNARFPEVPVFLISGAVTLSRLKEVESEFSNVRVFAKPLLTRELVAAIEEVIG